MTISCVRGAGYSGIPFFNSQGNSSYHSLQVRRSAAAKGFQFGAATWSRPWIMVMTIIQVS
jgi:hypothetical protein